MSIFKDIIAADVHSVFLNVEEFSDMHNLNGEEAVAFFTGTHDFRSFCDNRQMKKSTVRTIYSITLEAMRA